VTRTFECPQCGAEVRVGRPACPECGSDASTGWQEQEEIDYQAEDLPDGYAEPGAPAPRRRPWPLIVVLVLALALLLLALRPW
jgi:hypothetical protein